MILLAMASISVYGYDQTMLSVLEKADSTSEKELHNDMTGLQVNEYPKMYSLLALPFEVRHHIYKHLLPRTVDAGHKGIAWIRGNTAIMATNKQIYSETITVMYRSNTFLLDIEWDCITLAYQWLLPTGLVPKRTLAFPDQLASRNVALIQKFHVRVHHVDSYTGMIKYNYSGQGLTDGVKYQVAQLCKLLRTLAEIKKLSIELRDGSGKVGLGQSVLEPFLSLKNTQVVTANGSGTLREGSISNGSHVNPDYAKHLSARLNNAYMRNSFLRLPREVREMIYRHLFESSVHLLSNTAARMDFLYPIETVDREGEKHTPSRPLDMSMASTSRLIHAEATPVLYQSRSFYIACTRDTWMFGEHPYLERGHISRRACKFETPLSASATRNFFNIRYLVLYSWSMPYVSDDKQPAQKEQWDQLGKLLQKHPHISALHINFEECCVPWETLYESSEEGEKAVKEIEEMLEEVLKVRGVGKVKVLGLPEETAARFQKLLESPRL